ncbi:glycerophosphodiester phosphodiesterase family protein [Salegentibacter salegens]|uniref:Glycerophosphoryl diester phosphodiesterase n=1 Tax=Salegentibacter salegens TaxID=143223 RepID=A0A1M7MP21_9FLAO|nr:glycerophosphodiester phosphodiesterase family protein [Salegentibacter salegens]PRX43248.1 glycerophosphoryl diester phosphodiesterase [Salegentibacter salegens]SHM92266.1 glycerophosphoryl diester phosphodiesterase [Salegentibacter salegens]
MKFIKTVLLYFLVVAIGCKNNKEQDKELQETQSENVTIQVQGHRGDRGNFPENSIPAFISAVKKGADVIELDVVISKDKKVVVSHEPFMHSLYVLMPSGDTISEENQEKFNLYKMSYDSIKKFDSGSKGNRLFPNQQKQKTHKPLLTEAIDSVENYISNNNLEAVSYNIELKSSEDKYGIYQPDPEEFVNLVMEVIKNKNIEQKMNLQSFDVNILNEVHKSYPGVETAYLVYTEGIQKNLDLLDLRPKIYSPHYELVKDTAFVDSIKNMEMKLIPWTVNEAEAIEKMIELNVDGIITDYPERVLSR